MSIKTIGAARYATALATIPLSLAWGVSNVMAHNKNQSNIALVNGLINNQHLLGSSIFATVTTSAFLNMYPLRTLFFGLASLTSMAGHFLYQDQNDKNLLNPASAQEANLDWLEAMLIGCFGLAAVSKGNVLGLPKGETKAANHSFEFPKPNNLAEVAAGWRSNLTSEINILKWNTKNFPAIMKDLVIGTGSGIKNIFKPSAELKGLNAIGRFRGAIETNAPNCFRGAFQVTGLMRLSAFTLMLASYLINHKHQDEHRPSNKPHDESLLQKTAAWIVSLSLIPAALSALAINSKWSAIPNLLFNASALLAIPGLGFKFFPIGDFGKIAGGLCTKLLIATQMLAYALSQCMNTKTEKPKAELGKIAEVTQK